MCDARFSSSGFRVFLNSIFSLLASLVITARSKQGPNLAPFVQNNMVEAFCGKWQVDLSCTSGIEEYGAAMGFSEEKIAKYKGLSYTVEFTSSGDTHTAAVQFAVPGLPPHIYTFKLGETFDYKSIDGETSKLNVTLDDGKLVEHYKQEDTNKEWVTTRELNGNTMISTTTALGKSIVQKLTKV